VFGALNEVHFLKLGESFKLIEIGKPNIVTIINRMPRNSILDVTVGKKNNEYE
jgi:hypothetical protein